MHLWSALGGSDGPERAFITPEQARDLSVTSKRRFVADRERWIAHYTHRLAYERAMLNEQGGTMADKFNVEVGGRVLVGGEWVTVLRVNKTGDRINSVTTTARYCHVRGIEEAQDYQPPDADTAQKVKAAQKLPPLCNYPGEGITEITREKWDSFWTDGKGTRVIEASEKAGAHRARF